MTNWTGIGSIATAAHAYIDSIPTSVSGNMIDFASGAVLRLTNHLNRGVSVPIASQYQDVLVKMTAISALQRMAGIGTDFSYSLGDLSVTKGGKGSTPESTQIEILQEDVSAQLKSLGRSIVYYKANS